MGEAEVEVIMTNYMNIQISIAALMAAAEKFRGFVTSKDVTEDIELAASALEAGKEQEAVTLLRDAQMELARTLRVFINDSPEKFRRQLAAMKGLDQGLRTKLERAIVVYGRDVWGVGWEPAAKMYNTVAGLVAAAPATTQRIYAARAARIAEQFEAANRAALAAEKAEAANKAAVVRCQVAGQIRRMVNRHAA